MNCWQNCELNKKLTEHDKAIEYVNDEMTIQWNDKSNKNSLKLILTNYIVEDFTKLSRKRVF